VREAEGVLGCHHRRLNLVGFPHAVLTTVHSPGLDPRYLRKYGIFVAARPFMASLRKVLNAASYSGSSNRATPAGRAVASSVTVKYYGRAVSALLSQPEFCLAPSDRDLPIDPRTTAEAHR